MGVAALVVQAARTTLPADQRRNEAATSRPNTSVHARGSRFHSRAACSGVSRSPGISLNSPRTRSSMVCMSTALAFLLVAVSGSGEEWVLERTVP